MKVVQTNDCISEFLYFGAKWSQKVGVRPFFQKVRWSGPFPLKFCLCKVTDFERMQSPLNSNKLGSKPYPFSLDETRWVSAIWTHL